MFFQVPATPFTSATVVSATSPIRFAIIPCSGRSSDRPLERSQNSSPPVYQTPAALDKPLHSFASAVAAHARKQRPIPAPHPTLQSPRGKSLEVTACSASQRFCWPFSCSPLPPLLFSPRTSLSSSAVIPISVLPSPPMKPTVPPQKCVLLFQSSFCRSRLARTSTAGNSQAPIASFPSSD